MPLAPFLPFVRRWFEETFGAPTRPQREGWASIAAGRHTLIVAPTGSGKTLAAFLWTLDHLYRLALEGRLEERVYVVYVSPLRALNNDIEKNLREPLAGISAAAAAAGHRLPGLRVAVRTGDTQASARQAMTRRPPHVLITTPESLYLLLTAERFRPALASARFVIVDEIHALFASKRGAHLALSLERLAALAGEGLQRIGCSATVRPVEDALAFLVGAERHRVGRAAPAAGRVGGGAPNHARLRAKPPRRGAPRPQPRRPAPRGQRPRPPRLAVAAGAARGRGPPQGGRAPRARRHLLARARHRRGRHRPRRPDPVAAYDRGGPAARRARRTPADARLAGQDHRHPGRGAGRGRRRRPRDPRRGARPPDDARGPARRARAADRRLRGDRPVGGRRAPRPLSPRRAVPGARPGGVRRGRARAGRAAARRGQGGRAAHPLGPRQRPPARPPRE